MRCLVRLSNFPVQKRATDWLFVWTISSSKTTTKQMKKVIPRNSSVAHFSTWRTKGLFTWTRDSELPWGNDCPGASVTSRSHDDLLSRGNVAPGQLHCPRASSSKFDHYKFIWIPLVFKQIVTENDFKHVYLFLVLSETFLLENLSWTLIMSMRKTTLAAGQLLRSVHMEKSYLGKAGYPVLYNG